MAEYFMPVNKQGLEKYGAGYDNPTENLQGVIEQVRRDPENTLVVTLDDDLQMALYTGAYFLEHYAKQEPPA